MSASSPDDIARILRYLRRRNARARGDTPLTYRELASTTGWALGVISDYFNGKILPPTDRFDVLIQLMGASPPEQRTLAAVRDQVEESQRDHTRGDNAPDVNANGGQSPVTPTTSTADTPASPGVPPVPHQVPSSVAQFVGRLAALAELTALADQAGTMATATAVISTIDGAAGIGKTALALHWAHQVANRFPGGQLYANLRGFDPTTPPVTPTEVLFGFLESLSTPSQMIPASLDRRAALYRTQLTGRRVLIILDNASDAEQVRPLLPASPGCMVVVTSRNHLTSLVTANGAHPVTLDLLSHAQARDLLSRRLSPERISAEPEAVEDIIAGCGRLPLALAIVAARACAHQRFPLATYATELHDTRESLDAFSSGDPASDVRSVFSWSYQRLCQEARRLFRLLGQHPGPDLSLAAAASLAGLPASQIRSAVGELTRSRLVIEPFPRRFGMHDLVRTYATELASQEDPQRERDAALHRVLDHYLHASACAARALHPRWQIHGDRPEPAAGAVLTEITNHDDALAWFTTEHAALLAAVRCAFGSGFDAHAYQLAMAVSVFHLRQGRWSEMTAAQLTALAAARRLGDVPAQAQAHRNLGFAAIELGHHDAADDHLGHALDLLGALGDSSGLAQTHLGFSRGLELRGKHREALWHSTAAHELYRTAGDQTGQANALNSIGWCKTLLGEYDAARAACERSLALVRNTGDRWIEAAAWDSLGQVYHHVTDHETAVTCYQHALDLCRTLGDRPNEAETLVHLGDAQHATGNQTAARRSWQQALAIRLDLNHPEIDHLRARLTDLDRQNAPGMVLDPMPCRQTGTRSQHNPAGSDA